MKTTFSQKQASIMRLTKSAALITIISTLLVACMSSQPNSHSGSSNSNHYLFHGGNIVTMSTDKYRPKLNPEAILVKEGVITAIGQYSTLKKQINHQVQIINLNGKTLMPGFIEPHTHLPLIIGMSVMADLSPCLPEPYKSQHDDDEKTNCPTSLQQTYDSLNSSNKRQSKTIKPGYPNWIWGNGIDPSRLGNSTKDIKNIKAFINNPANMLNKNIDSKNGIKNIDEKQPQPIILFDQSGHVAYVNLQAFVAADICESVETCQPNTIKKQNSCPDKKTKFCYFNSDVGGFEISGNTFTGRILEEPNFTPFIYKVTESIGVDPTSPFVFMSQKDGTKVAAKYVKEIAQTGVTTVVNAGGFQTSEVEFFERLAKPQKDLTRMRYRTLLASDIKDSKNIIKDSFKVATSLYTDRWDEKNDGLFGAYGVKMWADGSTQGCSAYLNEDYSQSGICSGTKGESGKNYENNAFETELKNYWGVNKDQNWLVQVHANGDAAIKQTLETFKKLQEKQCQTNNKTNSLPITLHHATIGGNPMANENVIDVIANYRNEPIICQDANSNTIKQNLNLNITVSHTPAHIAYWGGAFQSILDGRGHRGDNDSSGRTTTLDPAQSDAQKDIPFSLHSDAPVSPINPLWYVEQMVNRNT